MRFFFLNVGLAQAAHVEEFHEFSLPVIHVNQVHMRFVMYSISTA